MGELGLLTLSFSIERSELFSIVEKIVMTCRKRMAGGGDVQHFFYIRVEGQGRTVKFSAYNTTRRIEILTDKVSIHKPFCVGVSASLLYSILREIPDGQLSVDVEGGFRIGNASSRFSLDILAPDHFPAVEDPGRTDWKPIDYDLLFTAINKVRYCASDSDNNRIYTRALCVSSGYFMCTDGFRLSLYPNNIMEYGDLLIPAESCSALHSVFKDEKADGFISCDESTLYFSKGGVYLSLRLLSGQVPKFTQVLPKGPCVSCVIPRDMLRDALRRVEIIAKDGSKVLAVDLTLSASGLLASSYRGAYSAREIIPMTYEGESLSIKANLGYILEATKSLQGDEVVLEIRGKQLPIVLTDKKGEHKNVIMPLAERT